MSSLRERERYDFGFEARIRGKVAGAILFALAVPGLPAPATATLWTVDFEDQVTIGSSTFPGFFEGQRIVSLDRGSVTVTFGLKERGAAAPGSLTGAWIAGVGNPVFAYETGNGVGDTVAGGNAGSFFLTDGRNPPPGGSASLDYLLTFDETDADGNVRGVSNLRLDLYDFRNDGGGTNQGETATLTVYSERFGGTSYAVSFTPPCTAGNWTCLPEGNVAALVATPAFRIRSAMLSYDHDTGTGIDNIAWGFTVDDSGVPPVAAPEPGTLSLVSAGLAALIARRRRRR